MSDPPSLQSLFASAIEIVDNAQQQAFLDAACGDDLILRQELAKLVTAHRGNPQFMAAPAVTAALPNIAERAGDQIGPYKLLEQIGEGGMGLVFMAEQTRPLRRRVALKIIKPGLDTRAVIARFEAERQALALMDHPNIARVFDAGATDSGRPYFIMELVRGVPIDDFCRAQNLPVRKRIELFIDVCQAVQHAHQKGVIHRDLKPTNILVTQSDTAPLPKVIDFGVAKATAQQLTERTLFTGYAQIIGTPLYMSPEQADLRNQDIDTRSDVYSLGVVLYELLTDTTPFDAERLKNAGPDEMRRIIREEEPPKPSTRATTAALASGSAGTAATKTAYQRTIEASALKGELDWIVMKALEKDRLRRYQSASALAADVARYLAAEPVEAGPPTRRYRAGKFVRRNRVALIVSGAIAATLVIGIGVSLWQAVRATNAEHATALALAQKGAALEQARHAVDDMYTKVAEKWLNDQGELTEVQRELLESALAFYENFSRDNDTDPSIQYEALRAELRAAAIREKLGQVDLAKAAFAGVISKSAEFQAKHTQRLEFPIARILARSYLSRMLRDLGDWDSANEQIALAVREAQNVNVDRIDGAVLRERWAVALAALAGELTRAGRVNDAETMIQTSLLAWQRLVKESPNDFNYRYGLAAAYARLGQRQMWWGPTEGKAEASLGEAEMRLKQLLEERPNDRESRQAYAIVLVNLGIVYGRDGRDQQALEAARQAMSVEKRLVEEFPNDHQLQELFAASLANLAVALDKTQSGQPGESDALMKNAFHAREKLLDSNPKNINHAAEYMNLFEANQNRLIRQNKAAEAELLRKGADARIALIGRIHGNAPQIATRLAVYLSTEAGRLIEQGDYRQAADCLDSYPAGARRFKPDGFVLPDHTPEHHPGILVDQYFQQSVLFTTPAALLEKCGELARVDTRLQQDESTELVSKYTALAKQFRDEADLAINAWLNSLEPDQNAGFRLAFHGEKLVNDWIQYRLGTNGCDIVPKYLRDAYCRIDELMLGRLLDAAATRMSKQPKQHYLALMLSAAPEELRNVDLALKLAERSIKLTPEDDEAQQSLAWALFRAGRWQACIDSLPNSESVISGSIGKKDGPHSILAMALWKLGRRTEALKLYKHADKRLATKEADERKKEARGVVVMPQITMLKRLHEEALRMLHPDESPVADGNGQSNSGASPPSD